MTRIFLLAPLALAACGTIPCPVPVSCIEPDWCVCVTTGSSAGVSEDGGAAPRLTAPDGNGGPTVDDHGPGNGGGTKDDTSDGNGSSSEGGSDE